jgi:hypothetical protein
VLQLLRRGAAGVSDCPHGFASPLSCVDCFDDGNLPPSSAPLKPTVEYFLTAKYDGHCSDCNHPIVPSQSIARMLDGTYRHSECT